MRNTRTAGSVVTGVIVAAALIALASCSDDSSGTSSTPPSPSAQSTVDTTTPVTVAETAPAPPVVETTTAETSPIETAPLTTSPAETTPDTSPVNTDRADTTVGADTTVAPTTPASPDPPPGAGEALEGMRAMVDVLAADELAGRDNGTPGSVAAQDVLIGELMTFAAPMASAATGADAYRHAFAVGTNVIGVIPGTDLADEYVIVGAHYDHLGSDCTSDGTDDTICNGATDNATGSAVAVAVGKAIAAGDTPPRRSVIIALWDAEEDGLLGSAAYVANPPVPLEQTVAYVNFDIQGTNISPRLASATVMVGAETGGPNMVAAARAATQASSLVTVPLSLLFGQGRSDHATFVGAGVPSVFFTDATPPCYHTVGDESSIVDYPKLEQQRLTAEALVRDLANTDAVPTFDGAAPPATYADAVAMHTLVVQAQPDFVRFSAADRSTADQYVSDLGAIVDAGPDAFDDAAVGTLLSGAVTLVTAWANGKCEGFLPDP